MRAPCRILGLACGLWLALGAGAPVCGSGTLESIDITGRIPAPIEGFLRADLAPVRWDTRCIPVPLQINGTLDPLPNPLGPPVLRVDDTIPAVEASLETWNEIPTSFIDLQLVGATVDNRGSTRFDTLHEITFRPNDTLLDMTNLIATVAITTLMEDLALLPGTDLDEDGDEDVVAGIQTCQDADGDGDIELPAGWYRAGTILDMDVVLNTDRRQGVRFTVDDEDIDTERRSVDLQAVLTHELGHAHGLAHSFTNQLSLFDGLAAVMFPFLDTGDPVSELSQRALEAEDLTTSSYFYPEGSATFGPPALQPGDVAFDAVFSVITGEATHGGAGLPLAGGSVFALEESQGRVFATTITGTARKVVQISTGQDFILPDPDFALVDGRYRLPVPAGFRYRLGIEAPDGLPVSDQVVNDTTILGQALRLRIFPEELYNGGDESAFETRPGRSVSIPVPQPGQIVGDFDFVTNVVGRLGAPRLGRQEDLQELAPETFAALQIFPDELLDATEGDAFAIPALLFRTSPLLASEVVRFRRALIATGQVGSDGMAHLDLQHPLLEVSPFLGQQEDAAPLYPSQPVQLGRRIRREIERTHPDSLFLVLEGPDAASLRRSFVGVDLRSSGRSFVSTDGVRFLPLASANFAFQLLVTPLP